MAEWANDRGVAHRSTYSIVFSMYEPISFQPESTDANHELLKIWVARYLPELGKISGPARKHVEQRLRLAMTDTSRQATTQQIRDHLIADCAAAAADTQKLLLRVGLPPEMCEMQELYAKIHSLYEALIDCYEQSFIFAPVVEYLHSIEEDSCRLEAAAQVIPPFEGLMLTMGPMLRELKAVYFSSTNLHMVGFMTTHMHFTQRYILTHLDPYECLWLAPYLRLLDELMCMPWQRICSMVSTITERPDAIALVKRMIPKVNIISALVYNKALTVYPNHNSCQGRIQSTAVQRSSLRDLNMFQAYIWLSFLEDSTVMIEKQLLPICIQVFRLTNVNGELVTFAIQSIIEAIQSQLSPSEQALFHASSHGIERLFIDAYSKVSQVDLLRKQIQATQYLDSVSYTWQSH